MKKPRTEAGKIILGQQLIAGLAADSALDDESPVKSTNLQTRLKSFLAKRDASTAIAAASKTATREKNAELGLYNLDIDQILDFLVMKARTIPGLLDRFGLGEETGRHQTGAPGQPRTLEAPAQGNGFLFLDWKEALDGDEPTHYRVLRRQLPDDGKQEDVGSTNISEITLSNQPRGVELEYCVIAVNRAGESAPSNTVSVVL